MASEVISDLNLKLSLPQEPMFQCFSGLFIAGKAFSKEGKKEGRQNGHVYLSARARTLPQIIIARCSALAQNLSYFIFACGYQPAAGLVVAFHHHHHHIHRQMSKVYYTSPAKFGGGGKDTCPLPRQTLAGEVVTLVHY